MPELPEVETMRRGILGVVGGRIVGAERIACRLRPIHISPNVRSIRRRLKNRTIDDVGRVGKRVVLHLDNFDALVFEPRMTGLVLRRRSVILGLCWINVRPANCFFGIVVALAA